jgi:hypothetical protein
VLLHQLERLPAVARLGHDGDVLVALEELPEHEPELGVVIGQQDAHARIHLPPQGRRGPPPDPRDEP